MKKFLNDIRKPTEDIAIQKQIRNTFLISLAGILLGIFSKFLDCTPGNEMPAIFEILDIGNFLGRLPIWLLFAVLIAVYSKTPIRAGINVFLFFAGMLTSYYAYTKFIAGFFPKSYIMIWVALTIVSPFLAMIVWYAKGNGNIALFLSSAVVGVLFSDAFYFGFFYLDIAHEGLEIIIWLISIVIFYKNPKQLVHMIGLSVVIAVIWNIVCPFRY